MNRYQLAKLIDWAGGKLETRKRLQKVVYLLKAAGCPLEADYTLHHYGPYSHDVAGLVDEMVAADLLDEEAVPNMVGHSYHYELPEHTRQQLAELDKAAQGEGMAGGLSEYEKLARDLFNRSVNKLELASTVAYFYRQRGSWHDARQAAARFKGQEPDSATMREAEQLARRVVEAEAHA